MTAAFFALDQPDLAALAGYRDLWRAAIRTAVWDSIGIGTGGGRSWNDAVKVRKFRRDEARRWIRGGPSPLPFATLARAVGIEPGRARERLEALWARVDAAPDEPRRGRVAVGRMVSEAIESTSPSGRG